MIQQNTAEWLELRKTKIGASDAPIIMGVSPWTTPCQLFEQKLNIASAPDLSNEAKRLASLEEKARQKFEQVTGLVVFPKVVFHPSIDFMMASLDGITLDENIIVEIKCPGKVDHECAMDGVVPEKYYPQLQHQMEVTGLQRVYYFTYNDNSYNLIEVNRDMDYIALLLKEEAYFWTCMQNLEYPKMTEKDYVKRSDTEWIETAQEWQNVTKQMRELKEKESCLRQSLISMAANKNSMGGGIELSRCLRKGSIDYKSIPELQLIDVEKYRKSPIETWRFGTS